MSGLHNTSKGKETPLKPASCFNLCGSVEVQEVLKCIYCEKLLSVPPIFSEKHGSICGRCKFVDKNTNSKWAQQIVYESIAQYMVFPCSNMSFGCKEQLRWGHVEDHEVTCLFKKINCPFFNDDIFNIVKCKWVGSGPGLNEHLESSHGDLIKKLPEINFTELRSNQIFLTHVLKQLMIVVIKTREANKLSCLVMVNGTSADCNTYRYQLELYGEDKMNTLILRRNCIQDAIGLEENLMDDDKMIIIDLSVISDLLKNPPYVMGHFGIIKKSKKEIHSGQPSTSSSHFKSDLSVIDENMLRDLECPICKCYLVSPISVCGAGHSFCAKCKAQLDTCPTCRTPFYKGRNYALEKLTASINFPCTYKENGCNVVCSTEKLSEHEPDCSFAGIQCFLNCSSPTIKNMFAHLIDKHQDCLIVSGDLHILDVGIEDDEVERYFAICFGNDIFRLVVHYDGLFIRFSLQQYGVNQNSYNYELEIICSTETSEKLTITKECLPLTNNVFDNGISLPDEMICKFISEEDLVFFKVHLKKK